MRHYCPGAPYTSVAKMLAWDQGGPCLSYYTSEVHAE